MADRVDQVRRGDVLEQEPARSRAHRLVDVLVEVEGRQDDDPRLGSLRDDLGIGIFRSRTGPVWVGPAIWAFLLVEFVGSSVSRYASYLSVLLLAAALFSLAGVVNRDSDRESVPDRVAV